MIRIVVAKPGLDGHTRGLQIVARAFMEAGFEVIHLGLYTTPQQIATAAIQEDADVIGLSILSGASPTGVCAEIFELLRQAGVEDVTLIVGGIIHASEMQELKRLGVAAVFLPGTPTQEIIETVKREVSMRRFHRIVAGKA